MVELKEHIRRFAVAPYNLQVCITYAEICDSADRKGRSVDMADAFIAACAVSLKIPLMTNNRRHFEGIEGLRVVSAKP